VTSGGGRLPKKDATAPSWLSDAKGDYAAGLSLAELVDKHGAGHSTISRWLRWAGVTMRPPVKRHRLNDEQEQEVLRLNRQEGLGVTTIAKKFAVGPETIRGVIERAVAQEALDMIRGGRRDGDRPPDPEPVVVPTTPTPPKRRRTLGPPKLIPAAPDWLGEAGRYYREGKTMREVADLVGVNMYQISKWLTAAGVEIRKGTRPLTFTPDEEKEILRLHQQDWQSRRALARRFNVSIDTIGRAVLRAIARQTPEAKAADEGAAQTNGNGSVLTADQTTNGIISGGATV
jgi:transposase